MTTSQGTVLPDDVTLCSHLQKLAFLLREINESRRADVCGKAADRIAELSRAAAQSSGVRDGREIHRAAAFLECASSLENYSKNYGKQAGIALRLEAGRMRDAAVLIRKKYDEARAALSERAECPGCGSISDAHSITCRARYPKREGEMSEHQCDVCECGDYRHQHVGGTGRCMLGSLCTPGQCMKFRFFRGPSEADLNKPDPGRLVPPHGSGPATVTSPRAESDKEFVFGAFSKPPLKTGE